MKAIHRQITDPSDFHALAAGGSQKNAVLRNCFVSCLSASWVANKTESGTILSSNLTFIACATNGV